MGKATGPRGSHSMADSSTPSNRVDAGSGEAWSRLYGEQKIAPPPGADAAAAVSLGHSVARIRLF